MGAYESHKKTSDPRRPGVYQTRRRHIWEDHKHYIPRRENLRSDFVFPEIPRENIFCY
jgi:hypothetical protein